MDAVLAGDAPREQRGAGGGAHGGTAEEPFATHPLPREGVQVRRVDDGVPGCMDGIGALLIGKEQQDVWPGHGLLQCAMGYPC